VPYEEFEDRVLNATVRAYDRLTETAEIVQGASEFEIAKLLGDDPSLSVLAGPLSPDDADFEASPRRSRLHEALRSLSQEGLVQAHFYLGGPSSVKPTREGRRLVKDWDSQRVKLASPEELANLMSDLSETLKLEAREALTDAELATRCSHLLGRPQQLDTAVREACVILEDRLRKAIGADTSVYGVKLAAAALNPPNAPLQLSDDEAEQQALHHLYRGVLGFFGNPTHHRLIEFSMKEATQIVIMIDLMLDLIRRAVEKRQQTTK